MEGIGVKREREREREERKREERKESELSKARGKSWIPIRTRVRLNGTNKGELTGASTICSLMKLIERAISFRSETTSDSYDIFLFLLC